MPSIATGAAPDFSAGRAERFAATYPENEALLSWLRLEPWEPVLEPDLPCVDWFAAPHSHRPPAVGLVFSPRVRAAATTTSGTCAARSTTT